MFTFGYTHPYNILIARQPPTGSGATYYWALSFSLQFQVLLGAIKTRQSIHGFIMYAKASGIIRGGFVLFCMDTGVYVLAFREC